MPLFRYLMISMAVLLIAPTADAVDWYGATLNGEACTGGGQSFGPWDYYDVDERSDRHYQEGRWWEARNLHAKPGLQALAANPFLQVHYNRAASEFDYLLRAYPNHPDILAATIELEIRRIRSERRLIKYRTPPECYMQRAQYFRPKQAHISLLMGIYLHRLEKYEMAITHYQKAIEIGPTLAEAHYNLSLAFMDVKDYESAKRSAHEAYALGYPLLGVQKRLKRMGLWDADENLKSEQ